MRVLFYIANPEWTGTSRAVLAAARGLTPRGHIVSIACANGSRLEMLALEAGVDTIALDSARSASDLRRVLVDRFIEVAIVTSDADHRIVGSAMRSAERGGVLRRIASFESVGEAPAGVLGFKPAPSGLLVSSDGEAIEPRPAGWAIPTCIAPLGVDVASYDGVEPLPRGDVDAPPEGLLIACDYDPSGRLRMGDVFRTLAFLAPRHAHIHALVVGPGSRDDELRLHASALGVGKLVSFLGERNDVRRVMRTADAGWVVSSGDGGAFGCLDFMALRIPVIAERRPLTQHYIADGVTGALFESGDPSYVASAAAGFLTANDRRVAMGNAARARVARDFAETAMLDGFDRAVNVAGDRSAWPTQ